MPYKRIEKIINTISNDQKRLNSFVKASSFKSFFLNKSKETNTEKIKIIKSESSIKFNLRTPGGKTNVDATKVPKRNRLTLTFKWAWQDSNLRPTDYESVALTN